jgi:hypothetical protein
VKERTTVYMGDDKRPCHRIPDALMQCKCTTLSPVPLLLVRSPVIVCGQAKRSVKCNVYIGYCNGLELTDVTNGMVL